MSCSCRNGSRIIVSGSGRPDLYVQFFDKQGSPVNLSLASTTVSMIVRAQGSLTSLFKVNGTKIDSGLLGEVFFNFTPTQLTLDEGDYEGQITIDYNSDPHKIADLIEFSIEESFAEVS